MLQAEVFAILQVADTLYLDKIRNQSVAVRVDSQADKSQAISS